MSSRAGAFCLHWGMPVGGPEQGGAFRGPASGQEEVAGFLPTPNLCSYFDSLEDWLLSLSLSHLVPFPCPLQIWVRKTSDSTKMRIYLGQLQRGLFVIRRRSAAWLSTVLYFPWPFFWSGFWFLVLFCFLLNRKFLTWELLLGLGQWRTLLWILQGTFMASRFHLCFILYCLDFFQPVTMRRFYSQEYWEFNLLICLFFFVLCVFFFQASFEFEGTFLFINCLQVFLPWRGAGRGDTLSSGFSCFESD